MNEKTPLQYWLNVAGQTLEVRELEGVEALSRPARWTARLTVDRGAGGAPRELLRRPASFALRRQGEPPARTMDGLVTEAWLDASVLRGRELTVVVESRLALSRHRIDLRIFRDRTAVEAVLEVLSHYGIEPELRLRRTYAKRPYNVQHRESDFNFVSRLLEDEGIFYYFVEGDVMVLGDTKAAYEPIAGNPAIPFRAAIGMDMHEEAITRVGQTRALAPSSVTLRDFNPDHPDLDMDVSARVASPTRMEYYDYPGEYLEPDEGRSKASLYAEEIQNNACRSHGESYSPRLAPGRTFTLTDAPVDIASGGVVVTEVRHDFDRARAGFSVRFEAADAEVTVRPPHRTPVPRMTNPLTGFVTCPPGDDDIHTDEMGRVKVHFHWDRKFPMDDTCSHWIPVIQDNTGQSSAMPRRGWEVLVHFLEGDPDRPVVLGRVYNAIDQFSEELPAAKTRTGLKSLSTPTRDGSNEIRIDDIAGREEVFQHAERNLDMRTANDKSLLVGDAHRDDVGRNEVVSIGGNQQITVGTRQGKVIGNDQVWAVAGNRERVTGGSYHGTVQQDLAVSIGGGYQREIGVKDETTARALIESVSGLVTERAGGSWKLEASKDYNLKVGGSLYHTAFIDCTSDVGGDKTEAIAGGALSAAGEEYKAGAATRREVTVTGSMSVRAADRALFSGAGRGFKAVSSAAEIGAGATLTIKVGEARVILSEDALTLTAPERVEVVVSGTNNLNAGTSKHI